MTRLTILISTILLAFPVTLPGQEEGDKLVTVDSLEVVEAPAKKLLINDYSMIGVNWGVTFSNTSFNPSKHGRAWVITPNYVSVMYTKYSKMFDYLPYFGLTVGAAYGHEGYAFEADEDGYSQHVDGATWCSMDVIEAPAMLQLHLDIEPVKLMANAGIYGGWRRSIQRTGPESSFDQEYASKFRDYEHRFDYGFQGGAGVALMFDPIEIHFNCLVRWGWSTLYDPNYYSEYYYRFAYPLDIMATVGIHFQLQKRKGRTTASLKREAYDKVYGKTEDNTGKDR